MRVQRIACDVRAGARHRIRAVRDEVIDPDVTEDPLIDEAQLDRSWTALQVEDRPRVAVHRLVSRMDAQLSAHAQVEGERGGRARERDPEELAPSLRGREHSANHGLGEDVWRLRRQAALGGGAEDPRIQHPHPGDRSGLDPVEEAPADGLDLGKFRHRGLSCGGCSGGEPRRWRARRPRRPRPRRPSSTSPVPRPTRCRQPGRWR